MTIERRARIYLAAGAGVSALAVAGALALSALSRGQAPQAQQQDMDMDMGGMDMNTGGMDMGGQDVDMGMATSMDGSMRLSSQEITTFGMTFGTAEVRPLTRVIRTVGMVEFDERRMAYVAPKFGGWVEKLHVNFTGQPVRTGQPLLEVYSPELVTAQEELLLAARMAESVGRSEVRNVAEGADALLASARRRLAYWDISDAQIRQLIETGEVRKTLTLYAPVSGIVMQKDVFEGQAFRSGQNLYMIADLSVVWVNAEVFETDAAAVREGMPTQVAIAALPGETFDGRIEYVYPTLEDRTRSMRARISIANPRGALKPGMYATVRFGVDLGAVLTLPTSAVLHSGERAVAFVDMGRGEIMPHELTLGVRGGEYVQVLDGIQPGQRVFTSAQFLLDSESNLAEVMKAMMAQMNMSDMEAMDMGGMDMGGAGGMDMGGTDTSATVRMKGVEMPTGVRVRPDTSGGR